MRRTRIRRLRCPLDVTTVTTSTAFGGSATFTNSGVGAKSSGTCSSPRPRISVSTTRRRSSARHRAWPALTTRIAQRQRDLDDAKTTSTIPRLNGRERPKLKFTRTPSRSRRPAAASRRTTPRRARSTARSRSTPRRNATVTNEGDLKSNVAVSASASSEAESDGSTNSSNHIVGTVPKTTSSRHPAPPNTTTTTTDTVPRTSALRALRQRHVHLDRRQGVADEYRPDRRSRSGHCYGDRRHPRRCSPMPARSTATRP